MRFVMRIGIPLQQMEIQKSPKQKGPNSTIAYLISNNDSLFSYFHSHCKEQDYAKVAVQLLQQAIIARKDKSIHKHYNVAYIKHNRFLSPSPKQSITPKVTEVVPVSPEKIIIFGKPRVKLGDGQFCVEHGRNQPQIPEKDTNNNRSQFNRHNSPDNAQRGLIQNQKGAHKVQNQMNEDSQTYLSPKVAKVKQNNTQKMKKDNFVSKQHIKSTKSLLNKESKTAMQKSQKQLIRPAKQTQQHERYDNVESKIKFLVERDKRNKKLEDEMQEQKKKLQKLEKRQQRLLFQQYNQGMQMQRQSIPLKNSQIYCSCSSDQDIDHKLKGIRDRLGRNDIKFSDKGDRLRDKTYKITSQPIYPITSSSSSQSDAQIQEESSDF